MNHKKNSINKRLTLGAAILVSAGLVLQGCGADGGVSAGGEEDSAAIDIAYAIFTQQSADCADYSNALTASVLDITQNMGFEASMDISNTSDTCTFTSNSIPNHDFNDASAHFATPTSEYALQLSVVRDATMAASSTALTQGSEDAIFLNGVVLDILSAGCYAPASPDAGDDGNTAIGCNDTAPWLLDPLGVDHKFGADAHNAHTQPTGQYHYHGNPMAMFDDNPGPDGSPVIGFAADGFPIFGSYFLDPDTGALRKALSGYSLKTGNRVAIEGLNPSENELNSADYDGTYVNDWEFSTSGDLDECNGMTVNGQYGYYVTDSYPWVLACFSGTPDASFEKADAGLPGGELGAECPQPPEGELPPEGSEPPEGCPLPPVAS